MNQKLKLSFGFLAFFILTGILLYFALRQRKIISPVPDKPDYSVMFNKGEITLQESLTFLTKTPTPKLTLTPRPTPLPTLSPTPTLTPSETLTETPKETQPTQTLTPTPENL